MKNTFSPHDEFIASLTERLSQPPSTAFNPHCLSEESLHLLIADIFTQKTQTETTKEQTKRWLEQIGLLAPIAIDEYPKKSTKKTRFYRLDISRTAHANPSPLELLQACQPAGVICYFTAVAFHSLSTQPPAHHHLAILADPRPKTTVESKSKRPASQSPRKKPDPLGTWMFTQKGLPYYQTSRERRLVPGIQTRYLNPSTIIRITTLEQTLLDTLHRPLSCGGPAVVMEAWEQGIHRAKEATMARYLRESGHLPIVQRLGYVLLNLGHQPGPELENVLTECLAKLDPANPAMRQQLFPGLTYDHLQLPWLIYGPT